MTYLWEPDSERSVEHLPNVKITKKEGNDSNVAAIVNEFLTNTSVSRRYFHLC